MTYRNILVAVDTTDEADEVIRAALELADEKASTLSVVTVIPPMAGFYANLFSIMEENSGTGIDSQALEHTTKWLSDLAKRHGIDDSGTNVVVGKPAGEIRQLAEKISADLIVMGAHGRHGLGLMLGSSAYAVLHGAPCNVLTVKV